MRVKIRKGDTVEIISGRLEDKGKRGEVINVLTDDRPCGGAGCEHPHQAPEPGADAGWPPDQSRAASSSKGRSTSRM